MNRRAWLMGGVGAAAVVGGVGWQQWHERRAAAAFGERAQPPWSSRFDMPGGGSLALSTFHGAPLVLNFWATWCPPCVREMPALDRFARTFEAKGIRVVGLAIDSPTPVRAFLAKSPVSYPIGLAGFEGTELTRQLGDTSGALPFTVVFDRSGEAVHRKLGETQFEELVAWTAAL
ncbi:MAG: TlpA family protein disulfide reductase [Pseudomonadota bacterium]|nr:TlpA family protein disulfide reductase [Pseudomonadota bacterium]